MNLLSPTLTGERQLKRILLAPVDLLFLMFEHPGNVILEATTLALDLSVATFIIATGLVFGYKLVH